MKMKMSIIMGVIHMNLGILMSLFNNQYFRDSLSIWAEFVPQVRARRVPCSRLADRLANTRPRTNKPLPSTPVLPARR